MGVEAFGKIVKRLTLQAYLRGLPHGRRVAVFGHGWFGPPVVEVVVNGDHYYYRAFGATEWARTWSMPDLPPAGPADPFGPLVREADLRPDNAEPVRVHLRNGHAIWAVCACDADGNRRWAASREAYSAEFRTFKWIGRTAYCLDPALLADRCFPAREHGPYFEKFGPHAVARPLARFRRYDMPGPFRVADVGRDGVLHDQASDLPYFDVFVPQGSARAPPLAPEDAALIREAEAALGRVWATLRRAETDPAARAELRAILGALRPAEPPSLHDEIGAIVAAEVKRRFGNIASITDY